MTVTKVLPALRRASRAGEGRLAGTRALPDDTAHDDDPAGPSAPDDEQDVSLSGPPGPPLPRELVLRALI